MYLHLARVISRPTGPAFPFSIINRSGLKTKVDKKRFFLSSYRNTCCGYMKEPPFKFI